VGSSQLDDLRRARRGDRDALARLLERNEDRLRRLAERRVGRELRARVRISDVLQSTYLSVLRYIADFDGESDEAFTAWLVKVFENTVRDKGRYFGALKRKGDRPLPSDDSSSDVLASPQPGPSTWAARSDDFRLFVQAFDSLSDAHKQVLFLRLVEGRPHDEIAERLGRTPRACRILFSRARAALALECDRLRRLGEHGPG